MHHVSGASQVVEQVAEVGGRRRWLSQVVQETEGEGKLKGGGKKVKGEWKREKGEKKIGLR